LTALVTTVTETLRYRGALGQWSWVLHRVTGLGVLFFLVLHVIDTSWAVFYPDLYVKAIAEYQTPLFTIGEFGLVAAVVYHALNGLRIAIFDFKPQWWKHQAKAAVAVLAGTIIILVPTFIGMFAHVVDHYQTNPQSLPLIEVLLGQVRFIVGIGVAVIAAVILSGLFGAIIGRNEGRKPGASKIERFWWSFMRVSGILIVPLVFGHLAMMHVIQGVFDITARDAVAVGAIFEQVGANASGTSVEFVADRWNTLVAGVAVWRVYDFALLALVVIHGFNGLRYVLTDYTMTSPLLRRAMIYLCVMGAVVLLVVGGGALIFSVNDSAIKIAEEAMANLHP
jgi:succinate dehydrogenase / fumarate reductase, cytochrome b subunit